MVSSLLKVVSDLSVRVLVGTSGFICVDFENDRVVCWSTPHQMGLSDGWRRGLKFLLRGQQSCGKTKNYPAPQLYNVHSVFENSSPAYETVTMQVCHVSWDLHGAKLHWQQINAVTTCCTSDFTILNDACGKPGVCPTLEFTFSVECIPIQLHEYNES